MLRNTHISHILLLCVIAFVIYQLCKPKEDSIKNSGTVEEISDTDSDIGQEESNHSKQIILNEIEEDEDHDHHHEELEQDLEQDLEQELEQDLEADSDMEGVITEVENEIAPSEVVENTEFGGIESDGGASIEHAFEKALDEETVNNSVDFNKNTLNEFKASDYLPGEEKGDWFDTDFSMAKKVPSDKLINEDKYIIGVDTVGQSLKNPTYDLRGTVAISKYSVSPWLNSTYEPDYNIKPLC